MTEPRRVALLARPGAALDRMRGALGDAGARIVLEADPTRIEPSAVSDASAEVVLVVLDPAIEESIDRFESVLSDSSIEVIFEEADLALTREGWDAARWVRHLAAKLHRHGDVLPPRRDDSDWEPAAALTAATAELELDDMSPVAVVDAEDDMSIAFSADDIALGGITLDDVKLGAIELDDAALESVSLDSITLDGEPIDNESLDNVSVDVALDSVPLDSVSLEGMTARVSFDVASLEGMTIEEITMESSDAELAGGIPADSALDVAGIELVAHDYDVNELSASGEAVQDLSFTVPSMEAPSAPAEDSRGESDRFRRDIADLERRIASMELVDAAPAPAAKSAPAVEHGAVLVLAGIGGPDAVRQLLGALPGSFSRPVLVQQRLDGGRYDRLVTQMQRATSLPVKLAEPGMRASAGEIYILPADVGVAGDDDGIVFNDRPAEVLASLPTAHSAVLLLSGADPSVVDTVLNQGWSGALVAGQAPEGCYDAAATNALIARGGTAGQPVELARRLAERWPS
ncbi:chemotaxis protein CheB [Lysobacter niastensis]|uniref:protein-glutamate methylesterase n=1 Tax=Lysobacter niastensis TaxID=380629 RepID=A0ABS0B9H4_9GAMM|nr:chemotaxis protein CheB [Lysobacter niastensis]MBF6025640.1 hypothetical protein [Lysobacter niastensis]